VITSTVYAVFVYLLGQFTKRTLVRMGFLLIQLNLDFFIEIQFNK